VVTGGGPARKSGATFHKITGSGQNGHLDYRADSCAAVVRVVANVGQEHHPLPGGWWRPGAVVVGGSALSAWYWARRTAAGVTPRRVTMSGRDTPATAHNRMISRSGVGSVALSARSRAH
jgi:hypothetical protein